MFKGNFVKKSYAKRCLDITFLQYELFDTTVGQQTIISSGGYGNGNISNLEAIGESDIILPTLPEVNSARSMVITNNNELMTFGGYAGDEKQCYKLETGNWRKENPLTQRRNFSVGIVMPNGIYCFGGSAESPFTSDFLPNGQSEWQAGPPGVPISPTEL